MVYIQPMGTANSHRNKHSGRPQGSTIVPYRIAMTLLYGKHRWIERDGPNIRIPVARAAAHFKVRAGKLREHLYTLENWGFIWAMRWNSSWATIQMSPPAQSEFGGDMDGDVIDV